MIKNSFNVKANVTNTMAFFTYLHTLVKGLSSVEDGLLEALMIRLNTSKAAMRQASTKGPTNAPSSPM